MTADIPSVLSKEGIDGLGAVPSVLEESRTGRLTTLPIRISFCTIYPSIVQHDMSIFLHYELENVHRENGFIDGWPGKGRIELLYQRASGLFIYASTACHLIQDPSWDPDESLSLMLQDDYIGQSPIQELERYMLRSIEYE